VVDIVHSDTRDTAEPDDRRAALDRRQAACGRVAAPAVEQPDALQALDHLTEGCQIFGRDYRCLYANVAAERHEQLSRQQLLGRSHTEVWAVIEDTRIWELLEDCLQARTVHVLERECTFANGSRAWFELHLEPVPDGAFVMSVDISARKRAELIRDKQREQLGQTQKLDWIAQLAGGIAHELNNMLAVILNCAEFAARQLGGAHSLSPVLEQITAAGRRSAVLTRKLMAFAQQQPASPEVIDPNALIEGLLPSLVRDTALGKDVELRWKPGAALWSVYIDPAQVEQVLANLIRNAREAMSGAGTISIETRNVHVDPAEVAGVAGEPGRTCDFVRITVHDDGCGMPPGTKARLFEPFCPGKRRGSGLGLGLATVYGIVKQNHGFIHVDSEPLWGTTLSIDLPRCIIEPKPSLEEPVSPAWRAPKGCVLLVDDEPMVLSSSARMLETLGYRVLSAGTAEEAVQLVREHTRTIDVLLTDVVMPDMNGPELAKRLLAIAPGLRVVFTSGSEQLIPQQGFASAGYHFIQKPYGLDELDGKIRQVFRERARA
jgi:two-component system, cell cycle sensor histidine kinase and response regulator CckA